MSRSRFFIPLVIAVLCGAPTRAQSTAQPAPMQMHKGEVRLEAKDGATHFTIGDPIALELVFSDPEFTPGDKSQNAMDLLEGKGRQLSVNTTEYGDLADDVRISPTAGWFQWSARSGHDYSGITALTRDEVRVPLLLNDGFVFRQPGHYDITVTTGRLSGGERTTNTLGIDLTARSADEESAMVRSLDAEIAADNDQCSDALARLAHLPGDDAVRAKVQWMLRADNNHSYEMGDGWAASRNYALQLQLLEAAWHDPHIVPGNELLGAMNATRLYRDGGSQPGWTMTGPLVHAGAPVDEKTKHRGEEYQADMRAAVASLPARSGQNRSDTAYFLLASAAPGSVQAAAVHPLAVEEFARMDPMEQVMLLETAWPKIRDPRLVPALVRMLEEPLAPSVGYNDALKRLVELDPERATPFVIREICNPASDVRMNSVRGLPQKTLPGVDACLSGELGKTPANPQAQITWDRKAELAVRFATAAILPAVRAALLNPLQSGARFAVELRFAPAAAVAALRLQPQPAEQIMFQVNTVYKACSYPFPAELLAYFRGQLRSPDFHLEEHAAFELSVGGDASDRDLLLSRLAELRDAPAGRTATATDDREGRQRVERQLMESIRQGRAWYTPNVEAATLAEGCLSADCRIWGKPRTPDAPFAEPD